MQLVVNIFTPKYTFVVKTPPIGGVMVLQSQSEKNNYLSINLMSSNSKPNFYYILV